jgi:cyclopropane-fatty-acyl-phospholipid synthase
MLSIDRCLAPGGLCLLHTIAKRRSGPNTTDSETIWLKRHIFPGATIPSMAQIGAAADGLFVFEDLQNIGADYDPTLMAWFENFDRSWATLRPRYDDRFYRLWKYYLLSAAGLFRSRKYHVFQIVLAPTGVRGGYRRPAAADAHVAVAEPSRQPGREGLTQRRRGRRDVPELDRVMRTGPGSEDGD